MSILSIVGIILMLSILISIVVRITKDDWENVKALFLLFVLSFLVFTAGLFVKDIVFTNVSFNDTETLEEVAQDETMQIDSEVKEHIERFIKPHFEYVLNEYLYLKEEWDNHLNKLVKGTGDLDDIIYEIESLEVKFEDLNEYTKLYIPDGVPPESKEFEYIISYNTEMSFAAFVYKKMTEDVLEEISNGNILVLDKLEKNETIAREKMLNAISYMNKLYKLLEVE